MQLRIGVLRSELERQRKALGREIEQRQKERAQLQKKGKSRSVPGSCSSTLSAKCFYSQC